MKYLYVLLCFLFIFAEKGMSQPEVKKTLPKYDLNTEPVLYTVAYAHLDTEWRWDYAETINKFIKATMDDNFQLFDKYKQYVFTFSGARRYKMMKEYYPDRYEKVKKYISQGRWFVGGSSVDECDANIPSPESIIRHVLYGNNFFRTEFGKESVDFLLPDCFGFQAHLPSALAHAGIKGFSTQKLEWGSAVGIPFNIGTWKGTDGKGVLAALNATDYGGDVEFRCDTVKQWVDRVLDNGKKYGVYADYRYYGTGDIGGSPSLQAVKNAIGSLNNPDSKIKLYLCSSDQLFRDLTEAQAAKLPTYSGDLLLTQHSAGSLTSQAYMKRWNRKNELLAQAAEPLAVYADLAGGVKYPQSQLNSAWWLVLGSQMHDILPGTCIPKAYEYAWNDEVLGLNLFSGVLETSAGSVIHGMDTRGSGQSIAVYNPLAISRKSIVEVELNYPDNPPEFVKVMGPDEKEVPVQIQYRTKHSIRILFLASLPSVGISVFDVQAAAAPSAAKTTLKATANSMENEFLKVTINPNGDISSIFDKRQNKEMLSAPARLEFLHEYPEYWPAWNMDWSDRKNPPIDYVKGPAKITLVYNGNLSDVMKIERTGRNSSFVQYISLEAGQECIVLRNEVAWQSKGVSLKASFPLTASNVNATYNLGLGTVERSTNNEKKYEVPSREWFDLTDKSGNFGVSILEDSKFGSDKPDDKTLRLTLLYTPVANFYHEQSSQDFGNHDFIYAIYPHKGDWRTALTEWQGRMLNQPVRAFVVPQHQGALGKTVSLVKVSNPGVDIRAIKKAENNNDIIVRVQELLGKGQQNVEFSFLTKVLSATEVDGQERGIADIQPVNGKLVISLDKFAIRSFRLQLDKPAEKLFLPVSIPLLLAYNQDVISSDDRRRKGQFDNNGYSIPAELFPSSLVADGIEFTLGHRADTKNNVISCDGQKILLPKTGNYSKLFILAAASSDTNGVFRAGNIKSTIRVQSLLGKIGQYDNRVWDKLGRLKAVDKGYIKRDKVAWFATHVHKDTSNIPYEYAYLFKYSIPVNPAAGYVQLPQNNAIKIFAMTVSDDPSDQVVPTMPLYDDYSWKSTVALNLPNLYVDENAEVLASCRVSRNRNLNALPGKVTMKDYADIHQPNGVTVKYFYSTPDTLVKKKPAQGMNLSTLVDGMYDLLPNDSVNDIWFDQGESRVWMDLQKAIEIDSIHIFANLNSHRGAEFLSLWGSDSPVPPDVNGNPKSAGWTYLMSVPPCDVWGNSKALYTILPNKGRTWRYLMWVTEDCGHGPYYFREIDVFERQK
ncbi:MAG: glycosyl hydrolase-related protein [Bacteroidetes bacterium]|nr:glycosyl hydrolase-related protein [Bacteroidota bacterium]